MDNHRHLLFRKLISLIRRVFTFLLLAPFFVTITDMSAAAFAANEDDVSVFIKDFEFYQSQGPQDSEEAKDLTNRRHQLSEMVEAEKGRLENSSGRTKENIQAHIEFLLSSIAEVDDSIAKKGDTKVPRHELHALVSEYKNQELTLEDMNEIGELITETYQLRGYILASASIPEQEIEDGILKIVIREGDVGEIKITGHKYYNERVIRRNFLQQLKHGVVSEDLLERGLVLSKELPSTDTRVVLQSGEKPGTSNIILNTQDRLAVDWKLDFNNYGSKIIGKERYGTNLDITDPWWGSTLSLRGVSGNDNEDSQLVSGDLSIPLNMYGTKLNLNYLDGLYVAGGQDLAAIGYSGNTTIYGFSLSHPVIRTRDRSLTFLLGYNNKYSQNILEGELQNIDDLDVLYTGIDYDWIDRYLGKTLISFNYTWGSLNPDRLPYTRAVANHRFRHYNLNVARLQKVYGNVNFIARFSGQISNENLLPLEQMVIGGYGTVRGHDTSLFLGDSGFVLSGELLSAPPFIADKVIFGQRISQMVQLSLFYDIGRVYYSRPGIGEYRDERIRGYGGGIRIIYKDLFNFKFDVAFPTRKKLETEESSYFYFMSSINLTSAGLLDKFSNISKLWKDEQDDAVSE